MRQLVNAPDARLYLCEAVELAADLAARGDRVNTLIVDAPYSARTHDGHNGASTRDAGSMPDPGKLSRPVNYACWSASEVDAFCDAWVPLTGGWCVSVTDHRLAPSWEAAFERHGRYVFAPLPIYEPGSRIRLAGDGPSTWVTWVVVARPKTRTFQKWGTLPGGYQPTREDKPVVGGKSVNLMRAIVRDYSRPGDLVADPCCGAGTTLLAARLEGRRAIGCDRDETHADMARRRLEGLPAVAVPKQPGLFDREVG